MPGIYVALIHTRSPLSTGSLLYEYFSGHIICVCLCASLCISSLLIFIPTPCLCFTYSLILTYGLSHHLLLITQDLAEIPPLPSSLLLPSQAKEFSPSSGAATVLYVYFSFTFNHFLLYICIRFSFTTFQLQLWINQLNFKSQVYPPAKWEPLCPTYRVVMELFKAINMNVLEHSRWTINGFRNHPSKVGACSSFLHPHCPLEYNLVFAVCLIRYG